MSWYSSGGTKGGMVRRSAATLTVIGLAIAGCGGSPEAVELNNGVVDKDLPVKSAEGDSSGFVVQGKRVAGLDVGPIGGVVRVQDPSDSEDSSGDLEDPFKGITAEKKKSNGEDKVTEPSKVANPVKPKQPVAPKAPKVDVNPPKVPAKPVVPAQPSPPTTWVKLYPPGDTPPQSPSRSAIRSPESIVGSTNVERVKVGCPVVRSDSRLNRAAQRYASQLAANNHFSHTGPDGSTLSSRLSSVGFAASASENLGRGHQTADAAVDGWMKSTGHRNNILNCRYQLIGEGVATSATGAKYWVQLLGFEQR